MQSLVADLDHALRADDTEQVYAATGAYYRGALDAPLDRRELLLSALESVLRGHPPERLGPIAILAGALVESGASPAAFPPAVFDHLLALLRTVPDGDGEFELPEGYYDLERGAMACLSRSVELRRTLPQKGAILGAIRRYGERYGFLGKMLSVLDDEPLVVLHPATGRGFRLRIGGIADNFQLHLLLRGALAGPHGFPGEPPSAAAIAASTEGSFENGGEAVESDWQLAHWMGLREGGVIDDQDHDRSWIWNEGFPAEISAFEGSRTVLVGPSRIQRGWRAGRIFSGMKGRVEVLGAMPEPEVRALLGRILAAV